MSVQIGINKGGVIGSEADDLADQARVASEMIRESAIHCFEEGGARGEFADEEWFQAERDLFLAPESELIEKDGRYEIRVHTHGLETGEIKVKAMPGALVVEGSSKHRLEKTGGNTWTCEPGRKTLFRWFELPEIINVERVTATLDEGVLHLTAIKSRQERHGISRLRGI